MTRSPLTLRSSFSSKWLPRSPLLSRGLATGVVLSAVYGGLVSECGVMRNLMILAAVLVGLGTYMAQVADKMSPAPASANAATQKATPQTVAQASGRSLDIPRDARGHFQTDGRIDGQRVNFMIDTGAS